MFVNAILMESLTAGRVEFAMLASARGYLVVTHDTNQFRVIAGPLPGASLSSATWALVYASQFALRGYSTQTIAKELRIVRDSVRRASHTDPISPNALGDAIARRVRPRITSAEALIKTQLGHRLLFAVDSSRPNLAPRTSPARVKSRRYPTGPKTPSPEREVTLTEEERREQEAKALLVQRGKLLDRLKRLDRRPSGPKMTAKDLPPVSQYGDD